MQTASEFVDDLEKDIDVEDDLWGDGLELNVPKRTWTEKVEARDREVRLDERIATLGEVLAELSEMYTQEGCVQFVRDMIAELEAERGKEGEVT